MAGEGAASGRPCALKGAGAKDIVCRSEHLDCAQGQAVTGGSIGGGMHAA